LAGSVIILRASGGDPLLWAIAAASTAILLWLPKLNPLWVLGVAGMVAVVVG